jgi:hypothetical protein
MVMLVADEQAAVNYYTNLGFVHEVVGGHSHVSRDGVCFILHPAKNTGDIRPPSSAEGGLYFDAFCYTNAEGLLGLREEFAGKGAEIVNSALDGWWKEFTIRDLNGYRIAFGGAEEQPMNSFSQG